MSEEQKSTVDGMEQVPAALLAKEAEAMKLMEESPEKENSEENVETIEGQQASEETPVADIDPVNNEPKESDDDRFKELEQKMEDSGSSSRRYPAAKLFGKESPHFGPLSATVACLPDRLEAVSA